MEYIKDYSCVEKNEKVFSKNIENENDYSETLPAYCDDIYRIVKCCAHSSITSVNISPPEINISGKCVIKLTYYNESSSLCYADFEENFSMALSVENLSDSAFAQAAICDKYTSFRVINQRKIDVHSSSLIAIRIYDKMKYPCIKSCSGSKLKKDSVKSANIIAANISKIEFDEEFAVPADSQAINRIVSSDFSVKLIETKIIKDKVLVKAEVTARVLYSSGNDNALSGTSASFGISKIIEQNGIDENDIIICNLNVVNAFHKAKSGSGDSPGNIEVYGEICVSSVFIREQNTEYISDGYLIKNCSSCSHCECKAYSGAKHINESKLFNLSLDYSNDIKEVKELSLQLSTPVTRNGRIILRADAAIIYENESESLASMSASGEIAIDCEGREFAISAFNVKTVDYSLSSSRQIDLRMGIDINAYCYDEIVVKMLADISEGEASEDMPTLTIYFAKEKEKIWNIAKSFSSDEELIINENSLSGDTLDSDKILIIPRV